MDIMNLQKALAGQAAQGGKSTTASSGGGFPAVGQASTGFYGNQQPGMFNDTWKNLGEIGAEKGWDTGSQSGLLWSMVTGMGGGGGGSSAPAGSVEDWMNRSPYNAQNQTPTSNLQGFGMGGQGQGQGAGSMPGTSASDSSLAAYLQMLGM